MLFFSGTNITQGVDEGVPKRRSKKNECPISSKSCVLLLPRALLTLTRLIPLSLALLFYHLVLNICQLSLWYDRLYEPVCVVGHEQR
jgi:hypothetical protein